MTALGANRRDPEARALLDLARSFGVSVVVFDTATADAASLANKRYGSGNGAGGKLNTLDLMVHGVARVMNLPILCTGKDFAATDAMLHPASRIG